MKRGDGGGGGGGGRGAEICAAQAITYVKESVVQ